MRPLPLTLPTSYTHLTGGKTEASAGVEVAQTLIAGELRAGTLHGPRHAHVREDSGQLVPLLWLPSECLWESPAAHMFSEVSEGKAKRQLRTFQ